MPKVFKYQLGDKVVVSKMKDKSLSWIGKKGVISDLREVSEYDYIVNFEDGTYYFFYEDELTKLNIHNFEIGRFVKVKSSNEDGIIKMIDEENEQLEIEFFDGSMNVVGFDQVEQYNFEGEKENMEIKENETVADHLLETLLNQYKNEDNTYTVPEALLKNMLSKLYDEE